MIGLFRRAPHKTAIRAVYDAIVAQSRRPSFYLDYGVPDTVEGRFDMIVLHLALFFRRLGREPDSIRSLGQGVFDLFCRDMDHNLREMGVGDLAVPKKMRKFAGAFYGRVEVYDRALGRGDLGELASALARNVLSAAAPCAGARRLAIYMHEAARRLEGEDSAVLLKGTLGFPDPDTVPAQVGVEAENR